MVSALDEAIGNITDALKKRGFMNNSLIVFTTDVSSSACRIVQRYRRTANFGALYTLLFVIYVSHFCFHKVCECLKKK